MVIASPLEIVHNAPLLQRVARFFDVVGEEVDGRQATQTHVTTTPSPN